MALQADQKELDDLFSLVYEELRRLARGALRREYAAELSPTTLVHEAWLKMAGSHGLASISRAHFQNIAARAMRQILVDTARRRRASIHGGELVRVPLEDCLDLSGPVKDREILALDTALSNLHRQRPRQAEIVEARYFGGLTCAECAELFHVSEETILRDWRMARAWLICEIKSLLTTESAAEVLPLRGA